MDHLIRNWLGKKWIYKHVVLPRLTFGALTLLVGRQEGHPACTKLDICLLVMTIWLELARATAPVVTTTSITLSSNKIQNGHILVLAYQGCPGKWPLNKCLSVFMLPRMCLTNSYSILLCEKGKWCHAPKGHRRGCSSPCPLAVEPVGG